MHHGVYNDSAYQPAIPHEMHSQGSHGGPWAGDSHGMRMAYTGHTIGVRYWRGVCNAWGILGVYVGNAQALGRVFTVHGLRMHMACSGGILALPAHCALLLDYVPPEEPSSTPLGNALRIR